MRTANRSFLRFMAAFLAFAALLSLSPAALAASETGEPALDTLISDYILSKRFNGNNISVAYYNTISGEEYLWNGEKYFTAASIYKLPLNMYYYEMEAAGEISPSTYISGRYTLSYCHKQSLQYSNNELSQAMRSRLGTYREYKTLISKYGGIPEQSLPEEYYMSNKFNTIFILNTLKHLYDGRDGLYAEAIGYLMDAHPGQWFETKLRDSECHVAQKYGWLQSDHAYAHTAGIIYADEPFLLVVFTQDLAYNERVPGDIARICYDYTQANIGAWRGESVLGFEDVHAIDWFAEAVRYCAERGLMKGTSDTTFSPNDALTRGMFVTILGRFAGAVISNFTDVDYFGAYVEWAYKNGIANGVDESNFAPNAPITREQAAVMLYRYLKMEEPNATAGDLSAEPFQDDAAISGYAKEAVDALHALGIFAGDADGYFNPQGTFTRAEAAVLFTRLYQKDEEPGDDDAAEPDTPEEETPDTPEEETPDTPDGETPEAPEDETDDTPEGETPDTPEAETPDTPAESQEQPNADKAES